MRFHHFPIRVHSALQLLQRAGYLEYNEEADNQARVRFLVSREELYRLEQVSPDEERVIISLLRNYGGLFADYGYIDESIVAQQAGLTPPQTYDVLKALSQRHLLHFIPRRNVPYIRYIQRREDAEHIQLPREVYEDRLKQYSKRIQAMLHYAQSEDQCRSRQLLAYFGETTAQNCNQCDICLSKPKHEKDIRQQILSLLADKKPHHITELVRLPYSSKDIDAALTYLVQEEYILQQEGMLTLGN